MLRFARKMSGSSSPRVVHSNRLIGVAGLNASGKSSVCAHLRDVHGFTVLSLSDAIRDEIASLGQEATRDNLLATGNRLRNAHGAAVLAERTLAKLRPPWHATRHCDFVLIQFVIREKWLLCAHLRAASRLIASKRAPRNALLDCRRAVVPATAPLSSTLNASKRPSWPIPIHSDNRCARCSRAPT
jgi:hypothetical protein